VHPIQAEAVDYIWGRSIVLAALFSLAAFRAWLKDRHWVAVAWFAVALLAKEECAAFPLVLLLFNRKPLKPILAMLALSLAAGLHVVYATLAVSGAGAGAEAGVAPGTYFLAQGIVILRYLRLLLVPYGFTVDADVPVPPIWLGVVAWGTIAAVAWAAWKRQWKFLLAGLILLIPSSSIFPAADLSADRRMYFPLFAFAAAAAVWLARVPLRYLGLPVAAALALVSFARTEVWNSDQSLWREAVRRAPRKIRPRIQLARAVEPAEALEILAQARQMAPEDPRVAAEVGRVLLSEGQAGAALEEFSRALTLEPGNPQNYNNRGVALEAIGQPWAARADFERALQLDPGFREARENLQKLQNVR
jgi:hypothetical protein